MKLFKNVAIILALVLCWSSVLTGCSQNNENAADENAASEVGEGNEATVEKDDVPKEPVNNESETETAQPEAEEQPSEETAEAKDAQTEADEEPVKDTERETTEEAVKPEAEEQPSKETDKAEKHEENGDKTAEVADNTLVFTNEYLLNAVATCLGKDAPEVTTDDILSIKYLAIGPEDDGTQTVYVGLDDYADFYFSEEVSVEGLSKLVKTATIENVDNVDSDLGKFENLEVFEYYNFPIKDVSFLENYDNLYFGYFNENGIEDVSALSDYNPVTLCELDFTGNDIQDWTPVYHIKDKVIVDFHVSTMSDEDDNKVEVPFVITLADILDNENETEDSEQEGTGADDTQADDTPAVSFEDADFSVLFE